jgi:alkanesulfonate monooxygenase SsuD/methylene tetrahydromethanopterin reductase-like flavin-dependent oxidoreductase (luciferase family)
MVPMTTLGAVCVPRVPPEKLREVALAAEDAGLAELWLWEDCFWGGAVPGCAAALAWTERLRLGIGVLPVPLRSVVTTAMDTAMLNRLFPGRVTVGVGHGVQSWMRQVGEAAESPMTLLRENLTALRSLLAGEKLTADGRYVRLDAVELEYPPASLPPIVSAATGDRTLRLSGELADGTVLVASTPPEGVRHARELIDEGRARAGRDDPHRLVAFLAVPAFDADEMAAQTRDLVAAGADAVILQPAQADGIDPVELVRFVTKEIRPRITG